MISGQHSRHNDPRVRPRRRTLGFVVAVGGSRESMREEEERGFSLRHRKPQSGLLCLFWELAHNQGYNPSIRPVSAAITRNSTNSMDVKIDNLHESFRHLGKIGSIYQIFGYHRNLIVLSGQYLVSDWEGQSSRLLRHFLRRRCANSVAEKAISGKAN